MNKKGFTLIELLATIVVLALILGISIYVAMNVINKSKETTYKTTKNEVESNTDSYLTENNGRLFYIVSSDNKYEYQCVTVENLIDYGYLDKEVTDSLIAKDTPVNKDDYIYIERDITTKAVTKTEYVMPGSKYAEVCSVAVNALGDIMIITNPDNDKWSKYKDITIVYKLKNLNDQRKLGDYSFNHSYNGTITHDESKDTFANNTKTKYLRVTSNGTLLTDIKNKGTSLANKSLVVSMVDTLGPVISKGAYSGSNKVRSSVIIPLKVTDDGSGVDYKSFTKDDVIVKVGNTTVKDYSLTYKDKGDYELKINSDLNNGKITITIPANKVLDTVIDEEKNGNKETVIDTGITFDNTYIIKYDLNGGSGSIPNTTYLYSDSGTVKITSTVPTRKGHNFLGWNTDKSAKKATYSSGANYNKNIKKDVTLYAIWHDYENPTCSIKKSNIGSEGGVNLTITCTDNSGSCTLNKTTDNNKKNGTYTYTATDATGNKGTCSISVSSYSCNAYQYVCGSYQYACGTETYQSGTRGYSCNCHLKCSTCTKCASLKPQTYDCSYYSSSGYCMGASCYVPKTCTRYVCAYYDTYGCNCRNVCSTCTEPIYSTRTKYCTGYNYCTGYKTCYE